MQKPPVQLVYDKQCPVCERYCNRISINSGGGGMERVDARQDSAAIRAITARGIDIDQGMVIIIDEQVYHGADALHRLSLLSTRNGLFNRINYRIFRSARLSRRFYPLFKAMRNVILKIRRVPKINNLDSVDQNTD